ncbi:MAG TPA: RdgB/HAM1 family non-canonical purine NTP pyrophosphatase [Sulfurovum sp.]|jgi:XTP/dITP diphosphohydrolase|nr:MAG: non-canonical purine NTP pyrophosphatase, RdgB/HAM1 family [Sulfurovum sp. 35-42-20]OYZ26324.1 MAG: non-canonical purine NTP pyrophosphatase, RdgB/HAM1 family [Sulfurovum sp. 16-42-52]OYZ48798.1 MAG: non-canonical purine NTP pyrophosphatase, RdgB/HAM1 family [Sulfurovum sp. 24-42-9]OZA46498.1 MAG: non-canonical purine NTP pyrophosphatase, RdgB/HAM1 family [Sulfurovum sp. 17-42-90]OZA59082.1 MAG: non-canonical purine NTP pyrophosphatase, RdgB/HAM1 family [Sulfurovum sp. 39-42-12]HQR7426
MKIVLATGNKGKLREFQQMCEEAVIPFSELLEPFEIIEDGDTFAQNALIKARTIYERLGDGYVVIADDSGISLPLLNGAPGIYSARYAGEQASDTENLQKLIEAIKEKGVHSASAYYTAAIAIVSKYGEYVVHGWMYGDVVTEARGEKGFGYDPVFIPNGYTQTLGELDDTVKSTISHRAQALALAKPIIKMLQSK